MVTAATYQKLPHFRDPERLSFLTDSLLRLAQHYDVIPQAWAIFPNHHHFIAIAQEPKNLAKLIKNLHTATATELNRRDAAPGRKV